MTKFVVDASVVLKALLEEDLDVEKRFKKLLVKSQSGEIELFSSNLLKIEVGNGLRFALNDKNKACEIFRDFLQLPIKILEFGDLQTIQSLEKSYDMQTSVYDTSYHVLAIAQNANLITCDKKYFEKAKSLGHIETG